MMIGKIFLKSSFELGLANLKEYMESMPQSESSLGTIGVETQNSMFALVTESDNSKWETLIAFPLK